VLEQERDDLLARHVVRLPQAQLLEPLVLPDEVPGRPGEELQEALERRPVRRGLQVLDDVARDAALAQDVQRAARLPSAGVVVDRHAFHRLSLPWIL